MSGLKDILCQKRRKKALLKFSFVSALKHHTSKISDFSDVSFVSTFGFRGEALSSLCALSDLEITTRHAESEVGTILTFDHNGTLNKSTPTHRQVGTTIVLRNIFSTFPVRHKEFLRHLKKEYLKMIQLLSAYCLISVNTRITCTHISDKGKKNIVLNTNSSDSLMDNIAAVFGSKQAKQLMEIKQILPSKDILDEYFLPETAIEASKIFKLEGFISISTHGEGRSSSDRQFYFINGRPCDLPKVSKLINEIYHSFNKAQFPFVLLNVVLNEGCADVNVTPDKRQIFVPEEKVLLALIKTTLLEMYGKQPQMMPSTLNFERTKEKESPKQNPLSLTSLRSSESQNHSLKRKFDVTDLSSEDEETPFPSFFKTSKVDSTKKEQVACESPVLSKSKSSPLHNGEISEENADIEKNPSTPNRHVFEIPVPSTSSCSENVNFTRTIQHDEDRLFIKSSTKKSSIFDLKSILDKARKVTTTSNTSGSLCNSSTKSKWRIKSDEQMSNFLKKINQSRVTHSDEDVDESVNITEVMTSERLPSSDDVDDEEPDNEENEISCVDEPVQRQKQYRDISFSMDIFKQKKDGQQLIPESTAHRKFRSRILPSENNNAEEELKKEIRKENFSEMEIIGQFNLGFIIARLHEDLFIIDQHATDEKYNFEQLQKETILETQQLIQPQVLNLTAVTEAILLDNLPVFEMNGFKFRIDEEKRCGERVQLISVPVSHNWNFGKEDVDELIFMLTDNPMRVVRPSRVNQMFASRACRKSVMIGTALTASMMKKLVTHMGEIEQPWNCPHGRPTIRHLFNLSLLKS